MQNKNIIDIIFIDDANTSTNPYTEMAVIRAQFHEKGYITHVHFINEYEEDAIRGMFSDHEPRFILGTFNYLEALRMLKTLEFIKLTYSGIIIAIASPFVDMHARKLMNDYLFIDYAILGEANETSLELFECLVNDASIKDCKGILYRNVHNKIIQNDIRPYVKSIDTFPIADRSHQKQFHLEYVEILKNRGCNGICSFCHFHAFRNCQPGKYFRIRSAKNVVDEIENIYHESNGMKYKFFMGGFTCIEREQSAIKDLYLFAEDIIERKLKIVMHFPTRAETINKNTIPLLQKLKKAGVASVLIGFESMIPEDLELYKKIAAPKDNINAMKILNELDIELFPSFILFHPLTDAYRLQTNFDFLYESGYGKSFYWFQSYLQLHPGTDIVNTLVQEGMLCKNYDYLHIHEQLKWKHLYVKKLLTAFQEVPMSPILHRNQIRVYRLLNVVRNRLSQEIQERFSDIVHCNIELAAEMNERNYEAANRCLQMAVSGASVEQMQMICKEINFEKYNNEYEKMKMKLEVRFERVRKYLQ